MSSSEVHVCAALGESESRLEAATLVISFAIVLWPIWLGANSTSANFGQFRLRSVSTRPIRFRPNWPKSSVLCSAMEVFQVRSVTMRKFDMARRITTLPLKMEDGFAVWPVLCFACRCSELTTSHETRVGRASVWAPGKVPFKLRIKPAFKPITLFSFFCLGPWEQKGFDSQLPLWVQGVCLV